MTLRLDTPESGVSLDLCFLRPTVQQWLVPYLVKIGLYPSNNLGTNEAILGRGCCNAIADPDSDTRASRKAGPHRVVVWSASLTLCDDTWYLERSRLGRKWVLCGRQLETIHIAWCNGNQITCVMLDCRAMRCVLYSRNLEYGRSCGFAEESHIQYGL